MYSGCLDLGLGLGSDPSGLRGLPFGQPLGLGGGGGSVVCFPRSNYHQNDHYHCLEHNMSMLYGSFCLASFFNLSSSRVSYHNLCIIYQVGDFPLGKIKQNNNAGVIIHV